MSEDNLLPEGTKFSIHIHRGVEVLQSERTISTVRLLKVTYFLKESNSAFMWKSRYNNRVKEQLV